MDIFGFLMLFFGNLNFFALLTICIEYGCLL